MKKIFKTTKVAAKATESPKALGRLDAFQGRANTALKKKQSFVVRLREKNKRKPVLEHDPNLDAVRYQARFGAVSSARLGALKGLVMLDKYGETTLTTLEELLSDKDPEVLVGALDLLLDYPAPLPDSIIERMIRLAWDKSLDVRRSAAKALGKHPDPRAIGPLMGLLGCRDDQLREIVQDSLSTIGEHLGAPPPPVDGDV